MESSHTPPFAGFAAASSAHPQALHAAETALGVCLPDDYKSFLRQHDGGEGFIGENYLIQWATDELAGLNQAYEVQRYVPGLVLFGSNGRGEAFAFDTRAVPFSVVQVPFVGLSMDLVVRIAGSFGELLGEMSKTKDSLFVSTRGSNDLRGKEIFEIKPIILDGSPTDPANKTALTREQHIEAVRYWNRLISNLRQQVGR